MNVQDGYRWEEAFIDEISSRQCGNCYVVSQMLVMYYSIVASEWIRFRRDRPSKTDTHSAAHGSPRGARALLCVRPGRTLQYPISKVTVV